jgi:hypothetical protein
MLLDLHMLERLNLLGKSELGGSFIPLCLTLRLLLVPRFLHQPVTRLLVCRLLPGELLLQLSPMQSIGRCIGALICSRNLEEQGNTDQRHLEGCKLMYSGVCGVHVSAAC